MIVRDSQEGFVMIEQDHHAKLSGEMAACLKASILPGDEFKQSVLYAIKNHDYAWKMLDKQPFWNDHKQQPYNFTDFPNPPKTVFYKHGIDEVEKQDTYAALLCSEHYTRFLLNDSNEAARSFVLFERQRQERIRQTVGAFDEERFFIHYGLLQFLDNLSLFVCLNEPGSAKQDEHPFFKDGIPVSSSLSPFLNTTKVNLRWKNEQTVVMDTSPFSHPIDITLEQKRLPKETVFAKGVINSYVNADMQKVPIRLTAPI
ncbi:DUF3891 family protein [Lentibacillus cibarius]|uniref:DUF3891 family protein n=1 Tax=Lentibacillus cibarius TaxID=2583219 RepID=A0A549YH87_9BACI|nr:DUF3891 family protein [Lentibacillus cibarius]TRM11245.1 DUF3891 family protein [Lentibacillus cibarius]